jgi:ribonuclease HI
LVACCLGAEFFMLTPEAAAWIARIDGASRGNPGPAAAAVIIRTSDSVTVASFAKYLGTATNNFAEYQALLAALQYTLEQGQRRLRVLSDSELLVRQIQGSYKVRSDGLRPLYQRARKMIGEFELFSIEHVPREENREADGLANRALNTGRSIGIES